MTDTSSLKFDTLQIHAGAAPDPATGARQTPIYQTTAYVFQNAEHAARLFNLEEVGFIYSRLTNPTVAALQDRIAALEGGAGAVCCSSGHAAQIMALFPLMGPGLNIVASTRLYGGTITQFSQTIKRFGWSVKFVDFDDPAAIEAAVDDDTRALFCESIANPAGHIIDLDAVGAVAQKVGLPLIVDNTSATPYLCRPIEHGATLVVHSMTKYLTGNGTVTGGAIVDSGTFDWKASGKFPSLSEPEPAYHGLVFADVFGPLAFTFHGIAIGLRDLGMTLNPQAAHYTLLGIETLSLRMDQHVANAGKVAGWLANHPAVESVSYAGLSGAPSHDRIGRICPKGAGAIFTFALKGGYEACVKLVDGLALFSHVANLGDTRSLVIHSASTTHRQLTEDQQVAAGAGPNVVRLSIGTEDADDLIADFDTMMAHTPIRPSHLLAPAALLNQRTKAGVSLSEHAAGAGVRAHRFDFDIDAYLFAPTRATDLALSSAHLLADLARVGALEGVPQPSGEDRLIAPQDISTIFNGLERSADVIARPLSEQMERYCSALEKDGRSASGFRKFFAQVSERVSDEAYAEVQARFLNAREIEGTLAMVASLFSVDGALAGAIVSPEFKYLDFPLWATSKFRLAKGWGLRDSAPLSILDIGAGPGHLGLVLDLFGHDYLGIDCALYDVKSPSPAQHVYDELCRLFGVKRVEFDVGVDAMPSLDRRFDWVVCTMGTFSTLWEQGNPLGTPWTFEHWRQYLRLLQSNYLNPVHRGIFQINRQYLTDELAGALEEIGAEVDRKTSWFSFTEQTRF